MISEDRILQYWNHFTDKTQKGYRPKNITDIRLMQMKDMLLKDAMLWDTVMVPNEAVDKSPDELMELSAGHYQHARSQFWSMVRKKIEQHTARSGR
jgi:hypothetical protein